MQDVTTRLLTMGDVPALTLLARTNRLFLAPTNPVASDHTFSLEGQAAIVEVALTRHANDQMLPHVILDADGAIVGRINLNSIIRGAAQSASVGYWVTQDRNGRGIATAAVAHIVEVGFTELGLHRVQGETLTHNTASQVVLERNGFERIGFAPQFLNIAGRWQDHVLYQRINDSWTDPMLRS
jgi:ribosomal-protein-alanine N-acetyltransferase